MSTAKMGIYRSRILPHLMNAVMSTDENREIRSRVCADLAGTVVEIGFGSGLNIPYYPEGVHTVQAEIRRVLKPGGTLHFVEHGISPDPEVARR